MTAAFFHQFYATDGWGTNAYSSGTNVAGAYASHAFSAAGTYQVYDAIYCGCGYPNVALAQVQRNIQVAQALPHRVRFQAQVGSELIASTNITSADPIAASSCRASLAELEQAIPSSQLSQFTSALGKAHDWVDACDAQGGCTSVDRHSWFSAGSSTYHVDTEVFAGIACY